jgi:hypothetical protein
MPTSKVRHRRLSGAWHFQAQSVCNCIKLKAMKKSDLFTSALFLAVAIGGLLSAAVFSLLS